MDSVQDGLSSAATKKCISTFYTVPSACPVLLECLTASLCYVRPGSGIRLWVDVSGIEYVCCAVANVPVEIRYTHLHAARKGVFCYNNGLCSTTGSNCEKMAYDGRLFRALPVYYVTTLFLNVTTIFRRTFRKIKIIVVALRVFTHPRAF